MIKPNGIMRVLGTLAAALCGAAVTLVLLHASGIEPRAKDDISFADFAVVVLAALGIMVAILTFFLGVLAIFGWSAFRAIINDNFDDLFRRRFDANNPQYAETVSRLVEDARASMAAEALAKPPSSDDTEMDSDDGEQG